MIGVNPGGVVQVIKHSSSIVLQSVNTEYEYCKLSVQNTDFLF